VSAGDDHAASPPARPAVLLVGAGPGDPDLLTVKAVRAIAAADVILVDDLVNRAVLAHARADARIVEVGKRGGGAATPQAFINRLLVREARAGRQVVRLKGGDPFLFGRGGEERDALLAAGLAVEVVPGITSGLAAPLAAGVSVTHRDASPGVIFITGHEKHDVAAAAHGDDGAASVGPGLPATAPATRADGIDPSRLNWAALVATRLTLVIYMGVTRLADIERALRRAGMAGDTPVAAVERATLPGQRVLAGCLDGMAARFAALDLKSPAIVVIGDVAAAAGRAADLAAQAPLQRQPQRRLARAVPRAR
jgi:uroporphyrin-III C-methyltransferase